MLSSANGVSHDDAVLYMLSLADGVSHELTSAIADVRMITQKEASYI